VLSILSEEEAEDVTGLDLDGVMLRFSNLEGQNYTPESLMTYKSRLKSSIDDFNAYLSNPLTFKSRTQARERREPRAAGGTTTRPTARLPSAATTSQADVPLAGSNVLNIPLRADLLVRVHGLPYDLTSAEAKKIANVVLAMAMPSE
jgi:hypothetical protein